MPYCHRSSKGEMQTCMQAGIPSSSDPEGTCLYRCTGYLKSLRGQFLRAGFSTRIERIADCSPRFASVALQQSIPSSCRGNAGHWEPGVPTLAGMMQIWLVCPCGYQFGFAQEHQVCQNPAGFKTLQCYGTLGSTPVSWEESGSAAMFIAAFLILGVNYKIRAWNEGATVSAPRGLPPHYGLAGAGSTCSLGMKSEKRRLCQRPNCRTRHPNTKCKEAPPALGGWPGTMLGGKHSPRPVSILSLPEGPLPDPPSEMGRHGTHRSGGHPGKGNSPPPPQLAAAGPDRPPAGGGAGPGGGQPGRAVTPSVPLPSAAPGLSLKAWSVVDTLARFSLPGASGVFKARLGLGDGEKQPRAEGV